MIYVKEIRKLIEKYERKLKEGEYSIVDGSEELGEIIKDLKKIERGYIIK